MGEDVRHKGLNYRSGHPTQGVVGSSHEGAKALSGRGMETARLDTLFCSQGQRTKDLNPEYWPTRTGVAHFSIDSVCRRT